MTAFLRCLAVLFTAPLILAHSVWVEPGSSGELVVRFAEPDGRLERSPGHLDALRHPVAWKVAGTNSPDPLVAGKKSDHFLLADTQTNNVVQIETAYAVLSAPGRPGRLPNFYARWHPNLHVAARPGLTLDIVPTGEPGVVQAFFRGKPLPDIKATFRTPDEREVKLTADANGFLRFQSDQPGLHLLSIAHHRETLPGFSGGLPYDLTSHNASLTWVAPNP
jgi:hypothetical protein